MKNVEKLLIDALQDDMPGISVSADVPSGEDTFITLEQTAYSVSDMVHSHTLAVQCWAQSRFDASELAVMTACALNALAFSHTFLNVEVISMYNFPDADRRFGRYQIICEVKTQ